MPQIKNAEYQYYISEKSEDVARGGYYPSLNLTGSIGSGYSGANREVVGLNNLGLQPTGALTQSGELVVAPSVRPIYEDKPFFDQMDDNFNKSIGFRMSIPIFNGLNVRTNVQKAKLNVESAALALEQAKLNLRQDIQSAHNDAVAALQRYQAAEKSVAALETSFQYTQERFDVGLLNTFDYNNEKNRLNNARSELLQAKYQYIFSTKVLDFYRGQALTLKNVNE
jgi:outer membrane protein